MATAKKGSSKGKGNGEGGKEPKAPSSSKETAPKSAASSKKEPAAKPASAKAKPASKAEEVVDIGIPGFKDNIRLGQDAQALFTKAALVAVVALGIAAAIGASKGDGLKSFLHSYLAAYMVALAVGLGTLWWVTLQHLVNAHWSVVLRRIGELFANSVPVLALLALPLVIPTVLGSDVLYDWASHDKVHESHLLHLKSPYLNPTFFAIRIVFYFAYFSLLAAYWLKTSIKQDQSGEGALVNKMRAAAGPSMIVFALALTFLAVDLLMSLDATWFSTIFGVYYFASCVLVANATLILSANWLQGKGRLKSAVTTEHFHDVGKLMFAFTIFWAYIGFSQFMLIWYANIPEETFWYKRRFADGWDTVAWALLFGHFVVPFFGMLSRHVKRSKKLIGFWSLYVFAVVYMDMYWLVQPELGGEGSSFGPVDVLCLLGVLSAVVATVAFRARNVNLIPVKDPRLERSLAFENL
jgi:hypothetical protein